MPCFFRFFIGVFSVSLAAYGEGGGYFQKKAEGGDPEGQYAFAMCCYCGDEGVTKDRAEAVKWLTQAAKQGHAEAQFYLADCYVRGDGGSEESTGSG